MNVKKWFSLIIVFLFAYSFPAISQAQNKTADSIDIYIGLIGGSSLSDDIKTRFEVPQNPVENFDVDFGMKSGYLAGAKAGLQTSFTRKILALEMEYNRIENSMERWTSLDGYMLSTPVPVDGKIQIDAFFFNLLARYPEGSFHPYIGAGIGYSVVKVSDMTSSGAIPMNIRGGEQSAMAYQLTAGLDFDITKNIIIGLAYKYIGIPKISFDNTIESTPAQTKMEYYSHNFVLSACFTF